ncbi:signal recognition particle subunit SRP72-like [Saccoglossus kowalevskii]|uniref:Signal recognition particle subunit SRP72 n=1 Tax=Saccoglossus kowalevskii TaxID=10224 RepID=A0ABM0GNL5_SACKO|nr:PREDICTED: signal recognition particle subunit SRP72-like [Saccoglossus kowalevskii]
MAQVEVNLSALFTELNKHGQNGDYDRAIKVTNKILKAAPGDKKAFHCKVICLIQQSDFRQALKVLQDNSNLSSELTFEKAYCQYRLNAVRDALSTIRDTINPDIKLKELEGQVLYRLEEYEDCLDVYRDVIKNTSDDYEEERHTNLSAVTAALQIWGDKNVDDYGLTEDTFELCYNKACFLLGQGNIKAAEKKLREAESLCRQMLEDDTDITEEEIEEELSGIHVQHAYTLQLLGKNDKALKLYNQVVKSKPSDIGLMAVACNNIITLNKDQNVFDSKKKMKAATADGLEHKLTREQRNTIALNKCLLLMYTNQADAFKKSVKNLKSNSNSDVPFLIEAAQLCREKHVNKAIQSLKEYLEVQSNPSVRVQLTLSQLHLMQGNVGQACKVLRSIEELKHHLGMVSTLVSLYMSLEDVDTAIEILDNAVHYYRKNRGPKGCLQSLLKENANFKLRHGRSEQAVQMLEDLRRANPNDMHTLAQLISAYAQFNPVKAQQLSEELPSIAESAEDINVDALENSAFLFGPKYLKKASKPESIEKKAAQPQQDLIQKKKKKKRRGKLPKSYDTNVDPDPERWLPKRERSYYKGRKKDKKGMNVGKGTQGAASSSAYNDLDASKPSSTPSSPRAGTVPPSSASSTASSQPGPRQQKSAAAARKKPKKKGGKKGGGW